MARADLERAMNLDEIIGKIVQDHSRRVIFDLPLLSDFRVALRNQ